MFALLSIESPPDHIRGYLARFLSPVHTGLHVGVVTPRVADELWAAVCRTLGSGRAAMITSSSENEHGYEIRLSGHSRIEVRDYDGLPLPVILPADRPVSARTDT